MREQTEHAMAARAIRKDLKAAFPGVAFTVKSKSYSMGDHVRIDWTDGVPAAAVDKIVSKYQKGSFDVMLDLYEYSNRRDDIPQTRHVLTHRSYSYAAWEKARAETMQKFGLESCADNDWIERAQCWGSSLIARELRDKDFTAQAEKQPDEKQPFRELIDAANEMLFIIECRDGLKYRNDLITRDERLKLRAALQAARKAITEL